jgi:hypothetical protein
MRYILVKAQVHKGTPNTLSLLVLTKDGWAPWSDIHGRTNCTDPDLCPVMSFTDWDEAWEVGGTEGGKYEGLVEIVAVNVDNPLEPITPWD